jgi:hypothetical protein
MNRHLILPSGTEAKLEYAAISFEVRPERAHKPLYVFFRALNFTDDNLKVENVVISLHSNNPLKSQF